MKKPRATDSGGIGRRSASTRTSAPASRAASAWRCAQMPSTGSPGDGYHSATTATAHYWPTENSASRSWRE